MKDKIDEMNAQIEQGEVDYNHSLDIKSKFGWNRLEFMESWNAIISYPTSTYPA